jgi:hypothetical protein
MPKCIRPFEEFDALYFNAVAVHSVAQFRSGIGAPPV